MQKRTTAVVMIAVLVAIAAAILALAGCGGHRAKEPERVSSIGAVLQGEHKLRKMTERSEANQHISGSYFLITGDMRASSEVRVNVKFAWQMNDGTYALSSLPLEKFRVKVDENAATPTIRFRWVPGEFGGTPRVDDIMANKVIYALITAKESDWPTQVGLPLNAKP